MTSADLQRSLAAHLRSALDMDASPEYAMTWKRRAMQSGAPICRLAAKARRISGKGCSGWPTPKANERVQSPEAHAKDYYSLMEVVQLVGWPCPKAKDGREWSPNAPAGSASGHGLGAIAQLTGWVTPRVCGHTGGDMMKRAAKKCLEGQAALAGWRTPNCPREHDSDNTAAKIYASKKQQDLAEQVQLAGWATPKVQTGKYQYSNGNHKKKVLNLEGQVELIIGPIIGSFIAVMKNTEGFLLNPLYSLWLMGYPAEWAEAGLKARVEKRKKAKE